MLTRWFLVYCFSSFISLFHCNYLIPSTIQQKLAIDSKTFWISDHRIRWLSTALMCGRHLGLLRDGFCVFAIIITIAYYALLKLLLSYRAYFSFLFLRLSIRCRSCIFHPCCLLLYFFHSFIFSVPVWTSVVRKLSMRSVRRSNFC